LSISFPHVLLQIVQKLKFELILSRNTVEEKNEAKDQIVQFVNDINEYADLGQNLLFFHTINSFY